MGHGAQQSGPTRCNLTVLDTFEIWMNTNRILQIAAYLCFFYIVVFMYVLACPFSG